MASGLDRLIVAIDGTTAETYNLYRTNGNFQLVMENFTKILEYRKLQDSHLHIEWQMIDFPWNRCEQETARELARALGCDDFQIIADTSEQRRPLETCPPSHRNRCLWAYVLLLVNVYEDVIPCFKPGCQPGVLGNLNELSFHEIWNGEEIRRIRSNKLINSRTGCMTCME